MSEVEECSGNYLRNNEKSFDKEKFRNQYVKIYEKKGRKIKSIDICEETSDITIETTDGWNYIHDMTTGKVFMRYHNNDTPERYKDSDDDNETNCVIL